MDDEQLTVWRVSWDEADEDDDAPQYRSVTFASREATVASRPTGGKVTTVEIRRKPLLTETRWRGYYIYGRASIGTTEKYVVNEMHAHYGKPLTVTDWIGNRYCHAPTREEVLAYVHEYADPIIEAAQREAALNQTFRCPDHGYVGRDRIGSAMPCERCRRWVDKDGNRFGHYGKMLDGQLSYSTYPSNGYDEGPLPDGQRTTTT